MKWKTKKQESSTKPKLQSLRRVYKSLQTSGKKRKREGGRIKNGKGEMFGDREKHLKCTIS